MFLRFCTGFILTLGLSVPLCSQEATLPKVVLMGDSIRMGYAPVVEKLLQGKAVVAQPKGNGGDSSNLKAISAWAIKENPTLVHFNCGIHDTKKNKTSGEFQVKPDQYEKNLREFVATIRKETKATVVFALTTPIIDDRAAKGRAKADYELLNASVKQYNEIARRVMADLKVPVNDLPGTVLPDAETTGRLMSGDGVHFQKEGTEKLAKTVAEFVLGQMKK